MNFVIDPKSIVLNIFGHSARPGPHRGFTGRTEFKSKHLQYTPIKIHILDGSKRMTWINPHKNTDLIVKVKLP